MTKQEFLSRFEQYLEKFDKGVLSENSLTRKNIETRSFLKIFGFKTEGEIPEDLDLLALREIALKFFSETAEGGLFPNEINILCWFDEMCRSSNEISPDDYLNDGFEKLHELKNKIIERADDVKIIETMDLR